MCQFSDCKESVRSVGGFAREVRKKVIRRLQELVNFCPGEQKMSILIKWMEVSILRRCLQDTCQVNLVFTCFFRIALSVCECLKEIKH